MAKKIKVGIIGAGGISNMHIGGYQESPHAEVVAICDIKPEAAEAQAAKYGIPHVFKSADALLKLKEIDAVSVVTPNFNHKASSIKALRAGKHVMCEKPMAMSAREGQQMIDAATKARKILQIGLNNRFGPDVQFAKKIIDEGRIGKPYYARSWSVRRRGVPSWGVFGVKKLQGGGPLIDIGVHSIDFTWYMMGCPKPVAVSGKTYETIGATPGHVGQFGAWDWKSYTVEDLAVALVRFANGATMSIESAFCANLPADTFSSHIVGDKGGVGTGPLNVQIELGGHLTDCTPNHLPRCVKTHHVSIGHFVDSIVRKKPSLVPAAEAIWVQKIIDGIYASCKANREIRIK